MVRSAADRAIAPARGLFEETGDMMILTGKTIVSAIRPPYPYGGEFISQFLFALRLCWFPLLVSTVAFGYGAPGLQAANFLVGGIFASVAVFAAFIFVHLVMVILAGPINEMRSIITGWYRPAPDPVPAATLSEEAA